MPMKRDDHEALLTELLNPELEQTRRTDILQSLRADYNTVISDDEKYRADVDKLTKSNADLVTANSMLFRQAGISGNEEKEKEVEQKEFSETVTLEELEKGM